MSYESLKNNIDDLTKLVTESTFDISKFFSPDKEIIKRLITANNVSVNQELAQIMIYGLIEARNQYNKRLSDIENLDISEAEKDIKRYELDDEIQTTYGVEDINDEELDKIFPIKTSNFKDTIEDLKTQVKTSVANLSKEAKSLPQLLGNSALIAASSIGGISLLAISLPVPNIPGALSMLGSLIDIFIKLIDKLKTIISYLEPLKKINLLVDEDNLEKITNILNTFLKTIINVFKPITAIEENINKLLDFLKELFSSNNIERRIRKISRKLRKLNYLPNNNFENVDEDDIDEVEDILEEYEVINKDSKTAAVRLKPDKEKIYKDSMQNLENTISNLPAAPDISNIAISAVDEFLYDVELPDGRTITDITKDEVDELRKDYIVKIIN